MLVKTWTADDQDEGVELIEDAFGNVKVRVPLAMMDGCDPVQRAVARDADQPAPIRHSPGSIGRSPEAEAALAQAHAEYENELQNRWQGGNRPAMGTTADPGRTPDGRQAAYTQYETALKNAWRNGRAA